MRVSFVHYIHKMWPEDWQLPEVEEVLHVNHQGLQDGDPFLVSRHDDANLWWCGPDEDMPRDTEHKQALSMQAQNLTPELQFKKFLGAMLEHHGEDISEVFETTSSPSHQLPDTYEPAILDEAQQERVYRATTMEACCTSTQPSLELQETESSIPSAQTILSSNYGTRVFLPIMWRARKKKRLYPIFKSVDPLFVDLCSLLGATATACSFSVNEALWITTFWSLAFRLLGWGEFFVEAFAGRLPLPEETDLTALFEIMMQRKRDGKKNFGCRYRNQGVEKTIECLRAYVRRKPANTWWTTEGPYKTMPHKLYKHLTKLPHVSDFYAWQVHNQQEA